MRDSWALGQQSRAGPVRRASRRETDHAEPDRGARTTGTRLGLGEGPVAIVENSHNQQTSPGVPELALAVTRYRIARYMATRKAPTASIRPPAAMANIAIMLTLPSPPRLPLPALPLGERHSVVMGPGVPATVRRSSAALLTTALTNQQCQLFDQWVYRTANAARIDKRRIRRT